MDPYRSSDSQVEKRIRIFNYTIISLCLLGAVLVTKKMIKDFPTTPGYSGPGCLESATFIGTAANNPGAVCAAGAVVSEDRGWATGVLILCTCPK